MIRLWIREDGEQPKAIGRHLGAAPPPGPGKVVDVDARTADEARAVYATTLQAEPSEEQDPKGWTDWRKAKRLVAPVEIQDRPTPKAKRPARCAECSKAGR